MTTLYGFSQTVETVSTGLSNPLGMALNGNDLYVGQRVITVSPTNQIDMSSLPVGSYLVKATTDEDEKMLKVVKQ